MDPAGPNVLLSPKSTSILGMWNVKTMCQSGRSTIIAKEKKKLQKSILGLSETRWTSSRETKLSDGTIIVYLGHPDVGALHTQGVAFMLTPKADRVLISWESINSRLITDEFRNNHKRVATVIIQCYVPTNDTEENKEQFYSTLSQTMERYKEKDLVIVMGDF